MANEVHRMNLGKKRNPEDNASTRVDYAETLRNRTDELNLVLDELDGFYKDSTGISIKGEKSYELYRIADAVLLLKNMLFNALEENETMRNTLKKAGEKNKALRQKLEEQEQFKTQFGYDKQYEKWKKAQRTGRTPKTVDWEKYDHLVAAGLAQKDILQYLGISGNTLRKKLKDREAQKDR